MIMIIGGRCRVELVTAVGCHSKDHAWVIPTRRDATPLTVTMTWFIPNPTLCDAPRSHRIQRVTALLQLGLLAEAAAVLGGLVVGAALPDAVLDSDAVIKTPDGSVVPVGCVRYRWGQGLGGGSCPPSGGPASCCCAHGVTLP